MDSFDLRQWSNFEAAGGDLSCPCIVDHITIDSQRIHTPLTLFVALKGRQDGHQYILHAASLGCRYALVSNLWLAPSPMPPILLLKVPDPLKALQEIAACYRQQHTIPFIGIIGSYGKTMVKDLLQKLLESRYAVTSSPESFNSQIGVPLSLLTVQKKHEIALIEAAFSHPGELQSLCHMIQPTYTILTHVAKKHLVTMGNLQAIANECTNFLRTTDHQGWIIAPNDELITPHLQSIHCPLHYWDQPDNHLPYASIISHIPGNKMIYQVRFPDNKLYKGEITHHFYYYLDLLNITIKAAWLLKITSEEIIKTLVDYQPEPMRTEIWKSPSGTTFINDTYCCDPQSVDLALKHFDLAPPHHPKIFFFHGIKGENACLTHVYQKIGKAIKKTTTERLILVGDALYAPLIAAAKELNENLIIHQVASVSEGFSLLNAHLKGGETVLIKGKRKISLDKIADAFNDSPINNQCSINLSAIRANLDQIRQKLPPNTRVMVMIKALAYGTDDIRMANFLSICGIDLLGVSHVDEAISLRRAGVTTPIFVINAGYYEAIKIVKWHLEVGVSEPTILTALNEQVELLKLAPVKVHLHVNTGMGRLGCRAEQALTLAQQIEALPHLTLEGVMTHFASADDAAEDTFTLQQRQIFSSVLEELRCHHINPAWKHAANSSAALRFDFSECNMVRIGLAVYGLYASEAVKQSMDLKLAFSLSSRIVGINECSLGETISYGRSYKICREKQKIAVLPIGYFDGLHRNYSGKGHVVIRGKKAPMIGRITMDYMMVDVTEIPLASIGDPVLLFGEDEYGYCVSPEEFAFSVESIPHELITCLGPRIQRVFIYEESFAKKNCLGVQNGSLPAVV